VNLKRLSSLGHPVLGLLTQLQNPVGHVLLALLLLGAWQSRILLLLMLVNADKAARRRDLTVFFEHLALGFRR
jgi:hypothetical protein